MNPLLLTDFYKIHHQRMYPEGMTKLYSNGTCRKSRLEGVNEVVVFGMQHFIKEYLIKQFNNYFFGVLPNMPEVGRWIKKSDMIEEYKRHCPVDTTHIEKLWDLGYLPIEIKALPEGSLCPIRVPMFTITNTHPDFGWLVNYLETLLSAATWQMFTSATIAYNFRKLLDKYAIETTGSKEGVQWQGHDFSMRGMSSPESAILSGMGHLLSFTGTDTIPAIYQLERSYNATGLIGASVPATEHSVMCMSKKESEIDTFKRLLGLYPIGILSVVSDTWNLWKVLTEYLPILKSEIELRGEYTHKDGRIFIPFTEYNNNEEWKVVRQGFKDNTGSGVEYAVEWVKNNPDITIVPGKLVIRPDSGNPVDIICGINPEFGYEGEKDKEVNKGVIELLWDVFGGTTNDKGYKVLNPHVGAIYGDSINMASGEAICQRLAAKGFASTNIVLGIGSFQYQYNTRDTFGFAMKATYGEVLEEDREFTEGTKETRNPAVAREIWKDPVTDDGTKKSAKGLLKVQEYEQDGGLQLLDQQTWEEEKTGLLQTVFKDGKLYNETSLEEIRKRLGTL